MAVINFYAGGYNFPINNLSGSGLGFFGAGGFGASVSVGSWQDTTFITNGNGTAQGPQVNNVKWIHSASGQLPGSTNVALSNIPNYQGTLNIRFTHTTPVRTQNAQFRIYDRSDITAAASGVTTAVCPLIHPSTSQLVVGSGGAVWQFPAGTSYVDMSRLSNGALFSPGQSGLSPNGASTTDMTHDFFLALSSSPNSIGSKTLYGAWFQTEYL